MPQQLVQEVIQQAALAVPAVQAAALVHVARVLTAFDKEEAERILDRGIALAHSLPDSDRVILMPEVVATAAAVSPNRALRLGASLKDEPPGMPDRIVMTMLDHGHTLEAASYLSGPQTADAYPFTGLTSAMEHCREDRELQQAMLRGAIRVVREDLANHNRHAFLVAFNCYWKVLPAEEAEDFVREFLDWILQQPNEPWSQRFGYPLGEVRFSSSQPCQIFEILGPLRRVDPHRAESLIQRYPELAKAATVFPYGMHETMVEEVSPASPKGQVPGEPLEWDFVDSSWLPVNEWLKTCWEEMFKHAMTQFDADTASRNPNRAPREVWPSTQSFRNLMYKAGRYEGRDAVRRLARIPDLDVRLLAKIELIAGLVGLQMLGCSSRPPTPLEEQSSQEDKELESPNLAALPVRWEGRGQVREVRTEIADWDIAQQDWAPPRHPESSTFRPDGQLAVRASGSASVQHRYDSNGRLIDIAISRGGYPQNPFVCEYDDRGRIVRVTREAELSEPESPDPFGGMGGSVMWFFEMHVSEKGTHVLNPAIVDICYDDADRPVEVSYLAEGGMLSCRVTRTWNAAGLVETETQTTDPLPDRPEMPESVLTFVYDARGRCVEFKSSMHGTLRRTYLYDNHDNVVEANAPEEARRFEYDYDSQGNWIRRVTWTCSASESEYRPSTIERRTIEYVR